MKSAVSDAFWEFSLSLYNRTGVADRLIKLQDEQGAYVNMVLFCCWCGKEGRMPLGETVFQEADRYLHKWRVEVVENLRGVRRKLKVGVVGVSRGLSDPLRDELKRLEIEAERVSQFVLASLAPNASGFGTKSTVRTALHAYFRHVDIAATESVCDLIEKLSAESLDSVR